MYLRFNSRHNGFPTAGFMSRYIVNTIEMTDPENMSLVVETAFICGLQASIGVYSV
jgi:hypothetical protein